ncbi:MAG: hypothetical protein ACXVII_36595 [Solirubrobacteraceae bacterium]
MQYDSATRGALRWGLAATVTLAAAFATTSPALADGGLMAETTGASQQECQAPVVSQPFWELKDARHYVLAPGGDFSDPSGAGWQFFGGARIVDDIRPDGTTGGSLYLPSGSMAVSPVMCVDMTYPTARLWARTLSGDGDVTFAVSYAATKSELDPQSVGHVKGDRRGWKLSGDVHIKPELAGKDGGWRRVAFVLTAGGKTGEFQLDDIYVDPRASH